MDGDGDNDLTWYDIVGNLVDCSQLTNKIDIGAIQSVSDSPSAPACGDGSVDVGETCDDGNTVTETACNYGEPGGICTNFCRADCGQTLSLTGAYCGDSLLNGPETCDTGAGYVLTASCISLGFTGGTLTCASNCLSYNTSGCSLTSVPTTLSGGATLSGGSLKTVPP